MAKRSRGRTKKFNEAANVVDFKKAKRQRKLEEKQAKAEAKPTFESATEVVDLDREGAAIDAKVDAAKTTGRKTGLQRLKAKRGRRTFVYFAVVIILITMVGFTVHDIVKLKLEQREIKQEHAKLLKEKKELEDELQKVNEPYYIEQQARKQLRLILPGETLYILPTENKETKE